MEPRPNILWLSLESVRADHTSLYGYKRDTTPHLRQLSERSDATVLEPMIAASMWTPASTASMLTGTHLSTHQVGQDGMGKEKLPASITTLPELLSNSGYRTALFSTNHYISGATGLDRGFEDTESVMIEKSNFTGFDSVTGDSIRCAVRNLAEARPFTQSGIKAEIRNSQTVLLERRVKRWFRNEYSGDSPFFAYVHIPSPHHEYYPPARFRDKYVSEIELSGSDATALSQQIYAGSTEIKRQMATGLDFSESEWGALKALYDGEIEYADAAVSALISLAQSASERPLVIFVVGDHGDLFGECGLIGHNLVLHDGLVSVPGLVIGIDGIVDGPETITQQIDLTKTAASIADIQDNQFEGRDLRDPSRPYAISQRGIARLESYTTYNEDFDTAQFFENPFTSVLTNAWKYLGNSSCQILYDLPDETTNVAADYPGQVETLSTILEDEGIEWRQTGRGEGAEFDEKTRKQLRDLGYLS